MDRDDTTVRPVVPTGGDEPVATDQRPAALPTGTAEVRGDKRRGKPRPFWVELPVLLVIAFVLTFLIQTFLFKVYYIPSGSMERTLHGVADGGDRVLVNKVVYDFSDPSPGEVVVFSGPPTWAAEASIPGPSTWYGKFFQAVGSVVGIAPPNEKDFVKRVIATAGQTVQCCDAAGSVTVDGKALDEPYIFENFPFTAGTSDCTTAVKSQRCFGPVTIPADSLWVMGDHRSQSKDSAYYCRGNQPLGKCQGPIPKDNVIGHAVFVVMPVSRWQVVNSPDIQGAAVLGTLALPLRGRRRAGDRLRRR